MTIQIRFNTDKEKLDANLLPWRVILNGEERLAEAVEINVPSYTTQDTLSDGKIKWHVTCVGKCIWQDHLCKIVPE